MAIATATVAIDYIPYPKQEIFHQSTAQEVMYGGAKGGGKSKALTMDAIMYAVRHDKAKIYLFRQTYDELEANIIDELFKVIPEKTKENLFGMFTYDKMKHIATFGNQSRIYFRYVQNEKDAKKYAGREMDYCGVDELTQHSFETIQILLSCMRSPLGHPPRFRGTANPGGQGHVWCKKRYVDATAYGKEVITDPETNGKIQFIPAKVTDNAAIMDNDPAYVNRLKNLPTELRKAFLDGNWEIFENQAFDEFRADVHTCKHFEIPAHWRRWRSNNPGYSDPFCWHWFAVDEEGTVHVYREFTREYGDTKLQYSMQAKKVLEKSIVKIVDVNGVVSYEPEKIDFTVLGHDAWQANPTTKTAANPRGKCIKDHYDDGGLHDYIRAITDRKSRKSTIHEYLRIFQDENTGKEKARVVIHDCCKKLIETLPLQSLDPLDIEKYKDTNYDHQVDCFGYGLLAYHASKSGAKPGNVTKLAAHKAKKYKEATRRKLS